MKTTLYELTAQYQTLFDMAQDGEIEADVFNDTLEAIEGEIEAKADGYAIVINEINGKVDLIDAEIKRLQARKGVLKNNVDRIKSNLENAMRTTGKTKFKTDLFSFNIAKNPASLKLDDNLNFDDIPAEFIKFSDPEIDKTAVKEAIKNGATFEWARMEAGESLRIK